MGQDLITTILNNFNAKQWELTGMAADEWLYEALANFQTECVLQIREKIMQLPAKVRIEGNDQLEAYSVYKVIDSFLKPIQYE